MTRVFARAGIVTFIAIMLLFALMVWTNVVSAQEATETPVPVETVVAEPTPEPELPPVVVVESEPLISWQSIAVIALSVILGFAMYFLSRSIPPDALKLILQAAKPGISILEEYAEITPTPLDDVAAAEMKRLIDERLKELLAVPAVPPAAQG